MLLHMLNSAFCDLLFKFIIVLFCINSSTVDSQEENIWHVCVLIDANYETAFWLYLLQLSFSPTTPRKAHAKLLGLLALLLMCTGGLLGVCVSVAFRFGITIFAFMAAEVIICLAHITNIDHKHCTLRKVQ